MLRHFVFNFPPNFLRYCTMRDRERWQYYENSRYYRILVLINLSFDSVLSAEINAAIYLSEWANENCLSIII